VLVELRSSELASIWLTAAPASGVAIAGQRTLAAATAASAPSLPIRLSLVVSVLRAMVLSSRRVRFMRLRRESSGPLDAR
jgi:hypothetical protein